MDTPLVISSTRYLSLGITAESFCPFDSAVCSISAQSSLKVCIINFVSFVRRAFETIYI